MDKVTAVGRRYHMTLSMLVAGSPIVSYGKFRNRFYSPWFSSGKSGKTFSGARWLKTPLFMTWSHGGFLKWGLSPNHPWIFHGFSMDFPWIFHPPFIAHDWWETKAWPSEAVTPHGGTDLAKTWRSAEGGLGNGWMPWTWWRFMDVTWCRHGMVDIHGCYLLVQNIARTDFLRFWLGFLKELDFSGSFGPEASQNTGISWRNREFRSTRDGVSFGNWENKGILTIPNWWFTLW